MIVKSETADSSDLGLSSASPIPTFTTTLSMRGTCIIFVRSNALCRAGTTSLLYFSCILFIAYYSATNQSAPDSFYTHGALRLRRAGRQHVSAHRISGIPASHSRYQWVPRTGFDRG